MFAEQTQTGVNDVQQNIDEFMAMLQAKTGNIEKIKEKLEAAQKEAQEALLKVKELREELSCAVKEIRESEICLTRQRNFPKYHHDAARELHEKLRVMEAEKEKR